MTLSRKDVAATFLTALVVLVFFTTHQGWSVWLIGGSHRWAAGAITLLGMRTCALGSSRAVSSMVLGAVAGVLAILALITGSLTALSLLVAVDVLLWAISIVRHATHARPLAA